MLTMTIKLSLQQRVQVHHQCQLGGLLVRKALFSKSTRLGLGCKMVVVTCSFPLQGIPAYVCEGRNEGTSQRASLSQEMAGQSKMEIADKQSREGGGTIGAGTQSWWLGIVRFRHTRPCGAQ